MARKSLIANKNENLNSRPGDIIGVKYAADLEHICGSLAYAVFALESWRIKAKYRVRKSSW